MVCTKMYTASWSLCTDQIPPGCGQFCFDLQLFNGEKTEDATPKRKQEARKKGQVAKSIEINTAFAILTAFLALRVVGPYMYSELAAYMRLIFSSFSKNDFTVNDVYLLYLNFGLVFLKIALPVMLAILVVSLAVNFMQVGFIFSLEPLMPQLSRINPLAGFGRLFSSRSIVELFKSLAKIFIIVYFMYRFIRQEIDHVPELINSDLTDSLQYTGLLVFNLAIQVGIVILVMATMDYFYQWWAYNKGLRMSKDDIKEEFKQTEGNPLIKGKIKERQRAMAMRRMMQEVPKATAVVTNPTHFAVAIKYDKTMLAPEVIAKGQDFLAERIKRLARENGVTLVENKPLARALYAAVEVGAVIPPELYQAVAEVLAYVFRLKKRLS